MNFDDPNVNKNTIEDYLFFNKINFFLDDLTIEFEQKKVESYKSFYIYGRKQ